MPRLFVYGSLMRGHSNAAELRGARLGGRVSTARGHGLVSYVEGFPALFREPSGRGQVHGEVYELDLGLLERLDEFEECPTLYQRTEIELGDGSRAFAYSIEPAEAARWPNIASGRWQSGG
jgi:gamma-glutamylaminecyclotransferase